MKTIWTYYLCLLINLWYELEADLITVAEVIPGKSLSRPTFLLSSVQTWNFAVEFALQMVSQLTKGEK